MNFNKEKLSNIYIKMNTNQIKGDLTSLKDKLAAIEGQIEGQMVDLEQREEKWKKMDEQVEEFIKNQQDVIRLNVGGKKFVTRIETLVGIKDTLFYKIVVSKKFNLQDEIFFDRNPKIFPFIMHYLRNKSINYSNFNREQLEDLKLEADYFEVNFYRFIAC